MAINLEQHRGTENVWNRTPPFELDLERWLLAAAAGALAFGGLRRRSLTGLLMVLGSGVLAWLAASALEARRVNRGRVLTALRVGGGAGDEIAEASEDSFPASDAPAWTQSTGSIGPDTAARRP